MVISSFSNRGYTHNSATNVRVCLSFECVYLKDPHQKLPDQEAGLSGCLLLRFLLAEHQNKGPFQTEEEVLLANLPP